MIGKMVLGTILPNFPATFDGQHGAYPEGVATMLKMLSISGFVITLGVAVSQPAAAQSDPCSTTGGYPEGSPAALLAGLRNLSEGDYAACVERRRESQPVIRWTPAQIRAAGRDAVVAELRDPSSATFRNVRRVLNRPDVATFCGEVNARNEFGGMTGFTRFHAAVSNRGEVSAHIDSSDSVEGAFFEDAWRMHCTRNGLSVTF